MASKITAYTELTTPADDDLFEAVDISDTSLAATGTNKKIQGQNLVAKKIKTTTGPTVLSVGAVADGEILKRSGATIIGTAAGAGGIGDVVGPSSATDNAIVRYDTATGKLIQNSAVSVDDAGAVTVPEIAAPSTPASGKVVFYAKADGLLYSKDDAGVETLVSGGAGGGGLSGLTTGRLLKAASATSADDSILAQVSTDEIQNTNSSGKFSIGTASDAPALWATTGLFVAAQRGNINNRVYFAAQQFNANNQVHIGGMVKLANDLELGWSDSSTSTGETGVGTGFQRSATGVITVKSGTWLQRFSQVRRLAGDAPTVGNTTMTNISSLAIPEVKAGRRYSFRIVLRVEDETAIDGLKFDLDGGSATMSSIWIAYKLHDSTGLVGGMQDSTALATDATYATVTGKAELEVNGCMVVNTAGTVIPRFAKNSGSTGNAIAHNNSFCVYEEQVDP